MLYFAAAHLFLICLHFCFTGPEHKGNVMVRKMSMQVEGHPDLEIDLDKGK